MAISGEGVPAVVDVEVFEAGVAVLDGGESVGLVDGDDVEPRDDGAPVGLASQTGVSRRSDRRPG